MLSNARAIRFSAFAGSTDAANRRGAVTFVGRSSAGQRQDPSEQIWGSASDRPKPNIRVRVYRTSELRQWGANPTRLSARLEQEGQIRRLGHGLLYVPYRGRFGEVGDAGF